MGVSLGLIEQADAKAFTKELMQNPYSRSDSLNEHTALVTRHPSFVARIQAAVRKGNEHLAHVERIKKVFILDRDFSQEHGELTPTMKVTPILYHYLTFVLVQTSGNRTEV